MDIFLLSDRFAEREAVDDYETFIWTERYNSFGDFELHAHPTYKMKQLLTNGRYITHNQTDRAMVIEESLLSTTEDGKTTLKVTGRSLEHFVLNARAIGPNRDGPELTVKGTPGWVAWRLVEKICINGEDIYELDAIPFMAAINATTSTDAINFSLKPQSLYSVVKSLCEEADLGFRITHSRNTPHLVFRVFEGQERPEVIFSGVMDNLAQESYLYSQMNYANVAYVWTKDNRTRYTVYAPGASTATGLDRRIIDVRAEDLDPEEYTVEGLREVMTQRGKAELAKYNKLALFDGQITAMNPYVYNDDYRLGDIVTLRGKSRESQKAVVTEYIFAADKEGFRSFPTFAAKGQLE